MGNLVQPRTYLIGVSEADLTSITRYLHDTGQEEFLEDIQKASSLGISSGEIMCSMFAKLCYASLVVGKNANVSKTRDIDANIRGCFDTGHSSVFEHCQLNFLTTNCSRVLTHELVRHRVGMAFSQTSGRYCRLDSINLVWDPILDPVKDLFLQALSDIETVVYLSECRLGLRKPPAEAPDCLPEACLDAPAKSEELKWVPDNSFDFDRRKALTSAIRRIAPNGQANEIAWSANIRSLRHLIMVRTAPAAETEIRIVANQAYDLSKAKMPLLFHGAKERVVNGHRVVYGMKLHPFEKSTDYLD